MVDEQISDITRRLEALTLIDDDLVMHGYQHTGQPGPLFQQPLHLDTLSKDRRTTPIRKRARRKTPLVQSISVAENFIRRNTVYVFTETLETALRSWVLLVNETTLPSQMPLAVLDLITAVNALEGAISKKTDLPARFGYFRLSVFFNLLEDRIRQERELGYILSESGRRDATIALDYYLHALQIPFNHRARDRISDLKRKGARWRAAAGPSVFLLLVYSDMAERFVYVSSPRSYNKRKSILRG